MVSVWLLLALLAATTAATATTTATATATSATTATAATTATTRQSFWWPPRSPCLPAAAPPAACPPCPRGARSPVVPPQMAGMAVPGRRTAQRSPSCSPPSTVPAPPSCPPCMTAPPPPRAPTNTDDCLFTLEGLASCGAFISGAQALPGSVCCGGLAAVVASPADACLCPYIRGDVRALPRRRLLELPLACGILLPRTLLDRCLAADGQSLP
ncbi:hypothetical protein ACP70R_021689 [Stipagrostis hirtigluma subsp. patula]